MYRLFITAMLFLAVFAGSFYLYHIPLGAVLYPALLCLGIGFFSCMIDFYMWRRNIKRCKELRE